MGFCKPYIPAIVIALILGAASAVFSVIGPGKISEITDLITEGLTGNINLKLPTLLFIIYPIVSTSLVMRDNTSPKLVLSKYLSGIRLIFFDISERRDCMRDIT